MAPGELKSSQVFGQREACFWRNMSLDVFCFLLLLLPLGYIESKVGFEAWHTLFWLLLFLFSFSTKKMFSSEWQVGK